MSAANEKQDLPTHDPARLELAQLFQQILTQAGADIPASEVLPPDGKTPRDAPRRFCHALLPLRQGHATCPAANRSKPRRASDETRQSMDREGRSRGRFCKRVSGQNPARKTSAPENH